MPVRGMRHRLREWYARNRRDLPWRREMGPWEILVSEVMLQQTRVAAVIPYYERFLAAYPGPGELAAAPEEELLALWSGLGYYSRARNLKKAARQVVERGKFPSRYEEIKELAGVGEYTAAAVASIAFGEQRAAVDGNVIRVLSRVTGEGGDVRTREVRERLKSTAEALLDRRDPGGFNQALMELGATVCLPREPRCARCPLAEDCRGRAEGRQGELPVKGGRREPVRIQQTLVVARRGGRLLMRQRGAGESRMPGFWELPEAGEVAGARLGAEVGNFRHAITHHLYVVRVLEAKGCAAGPGMRWVPLSKLRELPLATTAKKALIRAGVVKSG